MAAASSHGRTSTYSTTYNKQIKLISKEKHVIIEIGKVFRKK